MSSVYVQGQEGQGEAVPVSAPRTAARGPLLCRLAVQGITRPAEVHFLMVHETQPSAQAPLGLVGGGQVDR